MLSLLVSIFGISSQRCVAATSVNQHEITWTFDGDYTVGQFVNGDWWVLDTGSGVVISSVSPAPTSGARSKHGSVVNPVNSKEQGYDSAIPYATYDSSLRVNYPYTLHAGESLVSVNSLADNQIGSSNPYIDLIKVKLVHGPHILKTAAVLTCVGSIPPADAFRPAYAGTTKTIYRQSDINYALLPRLLPQQFIDDPSYDFEDIRAGNRGRVKSVGTVADQYHRYFSRPWLLHITDFIGRGSHPVENMPNYHAQVYQLIQEAAALLICDLDYMYQSQEMDKLLIPFLQLGIDTHAVTSMPGTADSSVAKWPVIMAGLLFDDNAMKNTSYDFRTEWMTYYGPNRESSIDSSLIPFGMGHTGYVHPSGSVPLYRQDPGNLEHEHLDPDTEWNLVPSGGGSKRESYRKINSPGWVGVALAAKNMQAELYWNHQAFFDYVDRWMDEEDVGGQFTISKFVDRMWQTHRGGLSGVINYYDFSILENYWLQVPCNAPEWCENFDINRDGLVAIADLINFGQHWLQGVPPTVIAPPENCNVFGAVDVFEDTPFYGTNVGASGDDVTLCGENDPNGVWHKYRPTLSGRIEIQLCGSDFETTVAIFAECGDIHLKCSDASADYFCDYQPKMSYDVIKDEIYLIRVAGVNQQTGNYILNIPKPTPPPANDLCTNAIAVNDTQFYNGTSYLADGQPLAGLGYDDPNDVWHTYVPAINGEVTMHLCGSSFDTTLAVLDSCNGTVLASNNDSLGCEEQSELVMNVVAGTTYYVRVAGANQEVGDYILTITPPVAHPVNDQCVTATEVFEEQIYQGTINAATGSDISSCGDNDFKDVWHRYSPSQTGMVTVSLCDSEFDTTLTVFDGCGGNEIACNDDFCGIQSELQFNAQFGQNYYIRVAGFDILEGAYQLYISQPDPPPPPPANDLCEDAITVIEDVPLVGTTLYASGSPITSCSNSDPNDVWYRYIPSITGKVDMDLCGSDFDTTLAVFDSCQSSELACNKDNYVCLFYPYDRSALSLNVIAGMEYFIRISGHDQEVGQFTLNVGTPLAPPANDDCQNALVVNVDQTYTRSSVLASGSPLAGVGYNDPNDVWHSLTVPSSGTIVVNTCGSNFDTTLAVFDGCGGNLLVANNNSDNCQSQSEVQLNVTGGATYYIRVAGANQQVGDYTLNISPVIPTGNHDACNNAMPVYEGFDLVNTNVGASGSDLSSCGLNDTKDVWHVFVPNSTGSYTFDVCGQDFQATLSVFNQCDNAGSQLGCDSFDCGSGSEINLTLTAGVPYYLRVAGLSQSVGTYMLSVD